MSLVTDLRRLIGDRGVLDAAALSERQAGVWRSDALEAAALARPTCTGEVSRIMEYCHQQGISVVPQGGRTGLVHGADASPEQVILSLERMNQIESIDSRQRVAVAQAGVPLETLHTALEPHALHFPLDLGARGSATLGGNAATNAGGNRVIRYGMMRESVLGLEVVLADGTVVNALNSLIKNNAGYDIKQWFIGSEGTLGIITRLSLRLREAPLTRDMALVAIPDFDAVIRLLKHMDSQLGGSLSAFEAMWPSFYRLITTPPALGRPPIGQDFPFYVLLESQGANPDSDRERLQQALESALEAGLVVDAAMSQSEQDCAGFWALRDDVEQVFVKGDALLFDIALPIGEMDRYTTELEVALANALPEADLFVFGHLGDGNLHLAIRVPAGNADSLRPQIEGLVYDPLHAFKGSVSAEHGIGIEKKNYLSISRSREEIDLMRGLKLALDPTGILNPGKIF
ncbi:D-2-hydroxyglutarate dehydrogenase [Luminiphilus syltensis NOR5-1B]|uniref:D-2-hydroxyglutarate dehydrogenase n=1 Tax=Luminiphilus syltensis NOR5-1B TaxID=565045 RepID=B8KRL3_9GAMM|nr:FAD-binding oxidoreductase [Luminiphilus syltensis]EED35311.1 D-2-hydroxyglutarate dehydrogenase [Luminiphilus syltensis NOR5-1B]